MAAVRRRNRISNETRQRIVQAYENPNEDYLTVADTLEVNRSTARGIVSTFVREGRFDVRPLGSAHNVKVDHEMKQCLKVRSHQRTQIGFGLRLAWDRTLGCVHTRLAWLWTSREYAM